MHTCSSRDTAIKLQHHVKAALLGFARTRGDALFTLRTPDLQALAEVGLPFFRELRLQGLHACLCCWRRQQLRRSGALS